MRKQLQALEGKRNIFTGEFVKVSGKKEHSGPGSAVLLRNIRDQNGQLLTDHIWINYNQEVEALQLQEGETIIFMARVVKYLKGKENHTQDYKLHYPSQIQRYGQHVFAGKRRKRAKRKNGSGARGPNEPTLDNFRSRIQYDKCNAG